MIVGAEKLELSTVTLVNYKQIRGATEQSMSGSINIIVIGASVGGVDAIRAIVAGLPKNLNAAVFVTLHVGAHQSIFPELLNNVGTMTSSHAEQNVPIRTQHIFVAPPDHHMTIERGKIVLTKGPRENLARPAIDPMFRSAARVYGSNVTGVLLTGGQNDGTAGLYEVKAQGGRAIVQNPANAVGSAMPQSAIDHVAVDDILEIDEIAPLLVRIIDESSPTVFEAAGDLATGDAQEKGMTAQFTQNHPVAVTCPDCGGALRQSELGSLTQFSCHIGHVYTAEIMLAAQFLALERFVEQAMRSLNERAELCRVMKEKAVENGAASPDPWEAAMAEALDQTDVLQGLISREWIHPSAKG